MKLRKIEMIIPIVIVIIAILLFSGTAMAAELTFDEVETREDFVVKIMKPTKTTSDIWLKQVPMGEDLERYLDWGYETYVNVDHIYGQPELTTEGIIYMPVVIHEYVGSDNQRYIGVLDEIRDTVGIWTVDFFLFYKTEVNRFDNMLRWSMRVPEINFYNSSINPIHRVF